MITEVINQVRPYWREPLLLDTSTFHCDTVICSPVSFIYIYMQFFFIHCKLFITDLLCIVS